MRKTIPHILLLATALLAAGCEKPEVEEEYGEKETSTTDYEYAGWHDSIAVDTVVAGYMTVAEAIEAPAGNPVNVKGYILGSTSRNIYNAIMAPPFESRSSLILADMIYRAGDSPDEYDPFYEDELLPVCLTDFKDTQAALNLVDHPEHWHKQIYIYGIKTTYLYRPGIKMIMKYEFVE